jgi:hypothetical protein
MRKPVLATARITETSIVTSAICVLATGVSSFCCSLIHAGDGSARTSSLQGCEAHAQKGSAAGPLSAGAPQRFLPGSMPTCIASLGLPHRKFSINIRSALICTCLGYRIVLPSADTARPSGRHASPSSVPRHLLVDVVEHPDTARGRGHRDVCLSITQAPANP